MALTVVDPRRWTVPAVLIPAGIMVAFGIVQWADARYANAHAVEVISRKIDEARIQDLENRILEIQCAGNIQCRQAIAARYVDQLRALRRSTGNGGPHI